MIVSVVLWPSQSEQMIKIISPSDVDGGPFDADAGRHGDWMQLPAG